MATKTPRTVLQDYMKNVNTEQGGRTRRRCSPNVNAPSRSSPRIACSVGHHNTVEQDVTPRHLIQNMLMVQGTAQPVTRQQKRVSGGAMLPPQPSSSRSRKTVRRRSSLATPDLEDFTRKFTPRTNIGGFLEQAPEETPAVRPAPVGSDSHTATNVSSFTLNEVGVSMLECSSGGGAIANVSVREVRARNRKRNLNIPLPETTPSGQRDASTAASLNQQQTQTPHQGNEMENMHGVETENSLTGRQTWNTPFSAEIGHRDEWRGDSSLTRRVTGTDFSVLSHTDHAGNNASDMERDHNRSGDRNVFQDVFGEVNRLSLSLHAEKVGDREDTLGEGRGEGESMMSQAGLGTPQRSHANLQGGDKTQTPIPAQSSSRKRAASLVPNSAGSGTSYSMEHGQNDSDSGAPAAESVSGEERYTRRGTKRSFEDVKNTSREEQTLSPSKRARSIGSPQAQAASSPRRSLRKRQTPSSYSHQHGDHNAMPQKSPSRHSLLTTGTLGTQDSRSPRKSVLKSAEKISLSQEHPSLNDINQADRSQIHRTYDAHPSTPTRSHNAGQQVTSSPSQYFTSPLHSVVEGTPPRRGSSIRGPRTSTPRCRNVPEGSLQNIPKPGSARDPLSLSNAAELQAMSAHHLDSESEDDGESYSPLKTPRLPEKQPTPATRTHTTTRRSIAAAERSTTQAGKKRRGPGLSQSAKKPHQGLPTSVVKATFAHFCRLRVTKEAIEEAEKISEQYWKNMAEDLEAYAAHAHRKMIDESDVHLLMRRQGFVTDKCSLNTLIATYLPLEQRQELIPIARSGNKLEPSQ